MIVERTRYVPTDGSAAYSHASRHRFALVRSSGTINWRPFAYGESGRVRALPYLTDLLIADVMQMDISYHSTDTENKPLSQVISGQDGPYWALRT